MLSTMLYCIPAFMDCALFACSVHSLDLFDVETSFVCVDCYCNYCEKKINWYELFLRLLFAALMYSSMYVLSKKFSM